MNLSLYAIAGTTLLALILGAFGYGYLKGRRSASEACAQQDATTLAASLQDWQQRRSAQDLADSAARAADQDRQKAATDALQAIQAKWENMRVAVVKMPPQAKCELSPEWVSWFNGTTP